MNNGAQADLDNKVPALIIMEDSRLAIQQSMGGDRMQEILVAGDVSASHQICRTVQLGPVFARYTVIQRGSRYAGH